MAKKCALQPQPVSERVAAAIERIKAEARYPEVDALFDRRELLLTAQKYWLSRDDEKASDAKVKMDELRPIEAELADIDNKLGRLAGNGDGPPHESPVARRSDITPSVPRQRSQELTMLAKLSDLGFDPEAVPLPLKRGKPSPAKQALRAALAYSDEVFEKAWKRLRKDGRVKDAGR